MMIQATVPTAFGLFFTPWILDRSLVLAGLVTLVSVSVLFWGFWRGMISRTYLAVMSLFYVVFAVGLIWAGLGEGRPSPVMRVAMTVNCLDRDRKSQHLDAYHSSAYGGIR